MTTRPAFNNPTLDSQHSLEIGGETLEPGTPGSGVPQDAKLVHRHVAFEQDGVCVKDRGTLSPKSWSAKMDAPTFVVGKDARAAGVETYLVTLDGVPKFRSFTWEQTVTVDPR